jgi:hypothetical protein
MFARFSGAEIMRAKQDSTRNHTVSLGAKDLDDGEDNLPMEPSHFEKALLFMSLGEKMKEACRACMVGENQLSQVEAAEKFNVRQSELSKTIRSIKEKWEQVGSANKFRLIEVMYPEELIPGLRVQEERELRPIIERQQSKKAKAQKRKQ